MHHRKARKTLLLPGAATPVKREEAEAPDRTEGEAQGDLQPVALEFGSGNLSLKEEEGNRGYGHPVKSPNKRVRIDAPTPPPRKPPQASAGVNRFAFPPGTQWEWHDTVAVLAPAAGSASVATHAPAPVASFDFEGTLVRRHSRPAASPAHDWEPLFEEVPGKLRALAYQEGKQLVVFTNSSAEELEVLRRRLIAFANFVGVPLTAYVSAAPDHMSLPQKGMWDVMCRRCKGAVLAAGSVHCGALAGREGDPSARDRLFAANCGVAFAAPEEMFLGHAPRAGSTPATPPQAAPPPLDRPPVDYTNNKNAVVGGPEVVLLVGPPGAGKSTFARRHLVPAGYNHVNQDRLGSRDNCLSTCAAVLERRQRVVVDNTNPDRATRRLYCEVARRCGCPVRCFWFDTDGQTARRLNKLRYVVSEGQVPLVPEDAYRRYDSRFEPPSMAEPFAEIRAVRFSPAFESPKHLQVFSDA